MWNAVATLVLLAALARAAPDFVTDFQPAVLELSPAQNNETLQEDSIELLRRQGANCATGYSVCSNINRADLCCQNNQVCSADSAGHAACCPRSAACTGTIGVIVGITTSISVTSTTASSQTGFVTPVTTTSSGATGTTDNPFVQATSGATPARSTVSNPYFPFVAIATTYTNAAACSSAYTSCQSDAASCTAALASGQIGVTVSAPNGGVTVTAVTSLGRQSASSVCESLSSRACSGLQVAACQAFGTGTGNGNGNRARPTGCPGLYGVAGGVALGIAGQLLR